MNIYAPCPLPPPPPGGIALPAPKELYSVADYWRYRMYDHAASMVCQRERGPNVRPTWIDYEVARMEHDTAPRAIVPYEHHRESRRLRKIKRLHPKHPHFFYRYYKQSGRAARPIKNWLMIARIKTHPDDGKYYQPCGAVPLPAPKPAIKLIPVPAMADHLPEPEGWYPTRITHAWQKPRQLTMFEATE